MMIAAAADRRQDAKLLVAGCLTERYLSELQADIPEVDRWLPFKDYQRLPAIVREFFPDLPEHRLSRDQRSQLTPPHYAFLKIAEGCDNTCNFCAIPLFRGKHRSRPIEELEDQARVLGERGVREINLISQHLDYYGQDRYGERRLPELVRRVAFNLDTRESDLRVATASEAAEQLEEVTGTEVNVLEVGENDPQRVVEALQRQRLGVELWNVFLLLALVFLVAETVVARQWKPEAVPA